MDDSNVALILTAIGIVATIVIPITIWLLRRETQFQLDVVVHKEVFLVNQLAGKLKNFSVLIDGQPASEQVVWITGWIINSGSFDIGKSAIEHPLKLAIPDTMSYLRVDIDNSSGGVECRCDLIDAQNTQFEWTLLRSGEFIYFDTLLQCPLEETRQLWDTSSFAEKIRPYSRIENTRTDSVVPISEIGEKYNPLVPRKHYITSKLVASVFMALFVSLTWTRAFFPFDLDGVFGDGFLEAKPSIVKTIDGKPFTLDVSIDRSNNVRLSLEDPSGNISFSEEVSSGNHREIFERDNVMFGEMSRQHAPQPTFFVVLLGFLTSIIVWSFLYMWFPIKFLFDSKRRRTAQALYSLRENR